MAGKYRDQPGSEKLCLKKEGGGEEREVEGKERNENNSKEGVDG